MTHRQSHIARRVGVCAAIAVLASTLSFGQDYTITTIAGGGSQATGKGDGGPAVGAWINEPRAIAVDQAGNIYVAQSPILDVRKVTPDGIISMIAGGYVDLRNVPGHTAQRRLVFDGWMNGIAVDGSGNVYVSERGDVRRISPSGVVSLAVGGGSCWARPAKAGAALCRATDTRLDDPFGLAVDSKGTLYIVDRGRNNILALQPDGTVAVVASMSGPNNEYGYEGDGGPVMQAKLRGPSAMTFDRAGNLYIADTYNNRVRKVDTTGTITTIAGNGAYRSGGFINSVSSADGKPALQVGIQPVSIAVDDLGHLFIAAPEDGCIWMVSGDGRARIIAGGGSSLGDGGPATKASLDPRGIALGKQGTIYVADGRNGRIRLLTPKRRPFDSLTVVQRLPDTAGPKDVQALQEGNLTLDVIADRVSKSIAENAKKYKDLLYKWELRAEFIGTKKSPFPTFSPASGEKVHTEMPAFYGHFQLVNNQPVSVLDGWADQPPLRQDLSRRISAPKQGEPETVDLIEHLLKAPQRAKLVGIASDNAGRAFVIESLPPAGSPGRLTGTARCAAAMRATVFIDADTYFPIRLDAEVVTPGMCADAGNMVLNSVGAGEQIHYVNVARKDPCGEVREIWVLDEAVQTNTIVTNGYMAFRGQIAQRPWQLGPDYRGGEFKGTTIRNNFQIFVTGACLIPVGQVVEAKPVESVHSEIHFALDDPSMPFRPPGAR